MVLKLKQFKQNVELLQLKNIIIT